MKKSGIYRNGQYSINDKDYSLAYLQKDGEKVLMRLFYPVVYWGYPFEKTEVDVVEYKCCEISKNFKSVIKKSCLDCIPVLCDDLTGTPFEYSSGIIYDAVEMLDKDISNDMNNHADEKGLNPDCETKEDFEEKYGIYRKYAVFAAMCVTFNATFEKLYRIDYMRKIVVSNVAMNARDLRMVNFFMEETFGSINFLEKKIHKVLRVPKCALELTMNNEEIPAYKKVARFKAAKLMFQDSWNSRNYFSRMSKDDYIFLMEWMERVGVIVESDPTIENARKMMALYGYKNWKNYLMFLETIFCSNNSRMYTEYIDRLYDIWDKNPDIVSAAEWRLSGDALKKSRNTIETAYCALMDEKNAELVAAYKELIPTWEKYVFEYGNYMVTYPKAPSCLLREGIALHHCAKDFLEAACDGRTTILFIRKKEMPEKPFYTLEVRNDRIRQCHGFDNCNVKEESDLEEFLKNFCKDKNITFDIGDNALAI